nr:probable amidase At4g34880 [Tanacetum cinerariifolium]
MSGCKAHVTGDGQGCRAVAGPAHGLNLVFQLFDTEIYTVDHMISQPAQPMSRCPHSSSPALPKPTPTPTPTPKPTPTPTPTPVTPILPPPSSKGTPHVDNARAQVLLEVMATLFLLLLALLSLSNCHCHKEATISELRLAFDQNRVNSRQLVEFYLGEIKKLNPILKGVLEVNPDALYQADSADLERAAKVPRSLVGLHGIPVLLKDTIGTKDKLNTTGGSFALLGSIVPRDAGIVLRLRKAGAIILGKATLSEWSNFRSLNAPSGFSPRGGQGKKAAIANMDRLTREGYEKMMVENRFDAVVTPGANISPVLAIGGFPAISVPAGYDNKGVPIGICFSGLKGSEPTLIEISYGFEQVTNVRKIPTFVP